MKKILLIIALFFSVFSFAGIVVTFNTAQYNLSITTRLVAMPATSLNFPRYLLLCNNLHAKFPVSSITVTKNVSTSEFTIITTLVNGTIRTSVTKKIGVDWTTKITNTSFWLANYLYMPTSIMECILKMVDDEDLTAITMTYL